MTKVWIGVDPGLQGAIAVLTPDGIEITPMPVVPAAKGGRDQYDVRAFVELLDAAAWRAGVANVLLTCERLHAMPLKHGGTIANYNRGRALMLVEATCVTLGISYQLVSPRAWQQVMHLGTSGDDTKQRSIMAAQRLFPGVSLLRTPRSRVPHDGSAEALLLADFGRRTDGNSLLAPCAAPLRKVS